MFRLPRRVTCATLRRCGRSSKCGSLGEETVCEAMDCHRQRCRDERGAARTDRGSHCPGGSRAGRSGRRFAGQDRRRERHGQLHRRDGGRPARGDDRTGRSRHARPPTRRRPPGGDPRRGARRCRCSTAPTRSRTTRTHSTASPPSSATTRRSSSPVPPSVAMVLPDELRHVTKDDEPSGDFLGLTGPGRAYASGLTGEDVVVGVIDTGIWPEHPSFADDGSYGPSPLGPLDDDASVRLRLRQHRPQPGRRAVHLQQQADRRPPDARHLPRRHRRRSGRVRLRPRRRRPRHPHGLHRGRQRRRRGVDLRS